MSITHIASARTYPTEADARRVLAERVSEALDAPYLGIWASPPDGRIPVALHVFGADDIPGRMAADGWRLLETPCWCSFLGEGMPVHERSGLCLPNG